MPMVIPPNGQLTIGIGTLPRPINFAHRNYYHWAIFEFTPRVCNGRVCNTGGTSVQRTDLRTFGCRKEVIGFLLGYAKQHDLKVCGDTNLGENPWLEEKTQA